MQSLKSSLVQKLQGLEHCGSVFETLARNADDETIYRNQSDLYEALLHDALSRMQSKSGKTSRSSPILLPAKHLTRMNRMSSGMQWGVQDRARSELFLRREVEFIYLQQFNLDLLYERLKGNAIEWPLNPKKAIRKGSTAQPVEFMISFQEFKHVVQELSHFLVVRHWLTSKLFMRLAQEECEGRVSINAIMDYVCKRMDNYQFRLELFPYDDNGKGYLTKEKLTLYLSHKLDMEERQWTTHSGKQYSLNKCYILTLAGEIFFLLDPHRTKRVRIVDILDSRLLQNVRLSMSEHSLYSKFMRKMSAFIVMDEDDDELISVSTLHERFPELSRDIWGHEEERQFLPSFLHRLADIYGDPCSDKEKIGFESFMDFTFACENLGTSFSSICYFFRALDMDSKGYLDEMDFQYHYRGIRDYLLKSVENSKQLDQQIFVKFSHIQSQVADMLAAGGRCDRVTPEKLYKTRGGHTLIELLTDLQAYMEKPEESNPNTMEDSQFSAPFLSPDATKLQTNDVGTPEPPGNTLLKDEEGQGDAPSSSI